MWNNKLGLKKFIILPSSLQKWIRKRVNLEVSFKNKIISKANPLVKKGKIFQNKKIEMSKKKVILPKNKEIQRAKRALKMVSYNNTSKIINLDSGKKERKLSLKQ